MRTSVVHYGVEARLVDADSGAPIAKQRVQLTVDSREHTLKTDAQGHFKVRPVRHHYCAWMMGGPFWPDPFRASIEITFDGYAPYTRESVIVPGGLDSPASDLDRLEGGYIELGDVEMKKR